MITSLDVLSDARVDDASALDELRRVLRPGGVLTLNLPAFEFLRGSHDHLVSTLRRFTRPEVVVRLERSGFEVLRAAYWNALLFPFVALVRLARRQQQTTESDVRSIAPGWNRVLSGLLSLERGWFRRSTLPFGTSLFCVARKR